MKQVASIRRTAIIIGYLTLTLVAWAFPRDWVLAMAPRPASIEPAPRCATSGDVATEGPKVMRSRGDAWRYEQTLPESYRTDRPGPSVVVLGGPGRGPEVAGGADPDAIVLHVAEPHRERGWTAVDREERFVRATRSSPPSRTTSASWTTSWATTRPQRRGSSRPSPCTRASVPRLSRPRPRWRWPHCWPIEGRRTIGDGHETRPHLLWPPHVSAATATSRPKRSSSSTGSPDPAERRSTCDRVCGMCRFRTLGSRASGAAVPVHVCLHRLARSGFGQPSVSD